VSYRRRKNLRSRQPSRRRRSKPNRSQERRNPRNRNRRTTRSPKASPETEGNAGSIGSRAKSRCSKRSSRPRHSRDPRKANRRPVPAGKPKLESFETLEAYQEALTDWKIDQRDAQRKAEEDRQAAEAAERKLQSAWSASEKTARATHPDYDDVVRSVQAPEGPGVSAARQAMLEEDSGAEILYYLGTHSDELRRIAALSPVSAVREIGKLSARLSPVAGNGKPAATALPKPPPALSRPAKVATESVYDEKFAASDFRGWERARMRQLKGQ